MAYFNLFWIGSSGGLEFVLSVGVQISSSTLLNLNAQLNAVISIGGSSLVADERIYLVLSDTREE